MTTAQGTIFDIQHFSLQDGPGIRPTVFFKGCPLRCRWCSNPESQHFRPQFLHYPSLCRNCGTCKHACPQQALAFSDEGILGRSDACNQCSMCVTVCRYNANALSGRNVSAAEVCEAVHQNWRIFMNSGGGITCSGGEPLAQPEFLRAILSTMHDVHGIDTCIETSGFAPWAVLESLLPYLDRMFLDIKHMDAAQHQAATGQSNTIILDNARNSAARAIPITVRTPLIPGFNDTEEHMHMLGSFMMNVGLREIELMPQHSYGRSKYEALGLRYDVDESTQPATDRAVGILSRYIEHISVHHI